VTCIAGVVTKEGVLLAGDSLGSDGYAGKNYIAPKVFRLSSQVAAGFCGSYRMGQLIEHHLELPPLGGDEQAWAIKTLIPQIRDLFTDGGFAHVKDNEETGGTWLLAVRRRLFLVQDDYSVLEARQPYNAVGCGEDFATGAMHALWKPPVKNPRAFLRAALDAASAFSTGVAAPYNFTSTRV
jgi:ATP-dependent protease HslVU (ClpYQ) peptidase subunit